MPQPAKETEVKFYVRDLQKVRRRLLALGADLTSPRLLERNFRFDTPDRRLSAGGEVLRLRQDSHAWLTYKKALNSFEERTEIETGVDDFEATRELLVALGYEPTLCYEKFRETFHLDPVEVMLDELPIGCFFEIEGPTMEAVQETAARLGLSWERRVRMSYMRLFELLSQKLGLAVQDITFATFADLPPVLPDDLALMDAFQDESQVEREQ